MNKTRRTTLLALATAFASPLAFAQEKKVLKVGTLKLIHGISPYFYEKFAPPRLRDRGYSL